METSKGCSCALSDPTRPLGRWPVTRRRKHTTLLPVALLPVPGVKVREGDHEEFLVDTSLNHCREFKGCTKQANQSQLDGDLAAWFGESPVSM